MTAPDRWRKPSRCDTSACVEVASSTDGVMVRNSTDPWVWLTFTAEEWAAFRDAIKAGEFDDE